MKTIKFRALKDDMSDFRFVYGNLIYDYQDNPRIQEDKNEPTFTTCIKGTEGQFTELKDKNKNKIFMGDIVECKKTTNKFSYKFTSVVTMQYGCFGIITDRFIPLKDLIDGNIKVIGNIYENPELL